ncbi:MAG: hypothetical protein WC307_02435 [Candidatus Nanoarchaeia archaeon]|jgi:hypothetical protein
MIVNFRFNSRKSSLNLSNEELITIINASAEQLKNLSNNSINYNLFKWLIRIANTVMNPAKQKIVEEKILHSMRRKKIFNTNDFKTLKAINSLKDLNQDNIFFSKYYNEFMFEHYSKTLINELKNTFKKTGINNEVKQLFKEKITETKAYGFLKLVLNKLLNQDNEAGAAVAQVGLYPQKLPKQETKTVMTESTTKPATVRRINPYSYELSPGQSISELLIKTGWREWKNLFMFNYKSQDIVIQVTDSKPLSIDFRPAWLEAYTNKLDENLLKVEFIKEIMKAKKIIISDYKRITINESGINPDEYERINFYPMTDKKINELFKDYLSSKPNYIKKRSDKNVLAFNSSKGLLRLFFKNNKCTGIEKIPIATKGTFVIGLPQKFKSEMVLRNKSLNEISERINQTTSVLINEEFARKYLGTTIGITNKVLPGLNENEVFIAPIFREGRGFGFRNAEEMRVLEINKKEVISSIDYVSAIIKQLHNNAKELYAVINNQLIVTF